MRGQARPAMAPREPVPVCRLSLCSAAPGELEWKLDLSRIDSDSKLSSTGSVGPVA